MLIDTVAMAKSKTGRYILGSQSLQSGGRGRRVAMANRFCAIALVFPKGRARLDGASWGILPRGVDREDHALDRGSFEQITVLFSASQEPADLPDVTQCNKTSGASGPGLLQSCIRARKPGCR